MKTNKIKKLLEENISRAMHTLSDEQAEEIVYDFIKYHKKLK